MSLDPPMSTEATSASAMTSTEATSATAAVDPSAPSAGAPANDATASSEARESAEEEGAAQAEEDLGPAEGGEAQGEQAHGAPAQDAPAAPQAAAAPAAPAAAERAEEPKGIEPAPVARLGGLAPLALPPPPRMSPRDLRAIRRKTGLDPDEHHDRLRLRLRALAYRAQRLQRDVVRDVESLADDVRLHFEARADDIAALTAGTVARVRAAYGGAKAQVRSMAATAIEQIRINATDADATVDEAALTSRQAIDDAMMHSSARVRALHETEIARVRTMLSEKKTEYETKGQTHGLDVSARGPTLAAELDRTTGSTALETAQNEMMGKAAVRLANERSRAFERDGQLRGESLTSADNIAQFSLIFLSFVNPSAVHIEQVAASDQQGVSSQAQRTVIRLATRSERAQRTIELGRDRAVAQLEQGEEQAARQLLQAGRDAARTAREHGLALSNGILSARAPYADAHRAYLKRIHQTFAPERFYDTGTYGPVLARALRGLEALDSEQRKGLAERDTEGREQLEAGLARAEEGLRDAARSQSDAAEETKRGVETAIGRTEQVFADGLIGGAAGMSSAADQYTAETEEELGLQDARVHEEMTRLIDRTRTSVGEQIATWERGATADVARFGTPADPSYNGGFGAVALRLYEALRRQVSELYNAAEELSLSEGATDEARMMRALHELTPKRGSALRQLYRAEHGSLDDMLLDELGEGDHYRAAIAYLDGRPSEGARYELSASLHWYGDDTTAIRDAMRSLTPEELAALRRSGEWESTRARVESSLTGTDRAVFQALAAGDRERADALDLRGEIERARRDGSTDAVVDAVAGIGPAARRYDDAQPTQADVDAYRRGVFRQYADVEGRVHLDRGETISDADAARFFVERATRDITVVESDGEGGTYERTMRIGEPGREAVRALAVEGPRSPSARAARLHYEVETHGRRDLRRLEAAGQDPEYEAARRDPNLTSPHASLREEARARLARLEGDRGRMFQRFAELQGQGPEVARDPARAREFSAARVEGLFGDDSLGREFGRSLILEGRANRAVALRMAMGGDLDGTDEDLIKRALAGMSHEEVEALREEYGRRFGNGDRSALDRDLGTFGHGGAFRGELSGQDRQDVERLLAGEARTDRDRARLAHLDRRHQIDEAGDAVRDGPGFAHERERILDQEAQLERMLRDAGGDPPFLADGEPNPAAFNDDGSFKGDSLAFAQTAFGVSQSSQDLRDAVDRQESLLTGVIQAIGAVAAIALTVATGGLAAPIIAAALTGLLTMAVKQGLRGSRYGWEEALVDIGNTAVDMAAAAVGGAKGFQTAGLTGSRLLARAGLRGLTTGALGAMGHTALNDRTWDRGLAEGLGTVFAQGARGGIQSAITSVATAGLGARLKSGLEGERGSSFLGRLGGRLGETGRASLENALSSSAGAMLGETAGILVDTATGDYHGNLLTALGQIGVAGGRELLQGAGEGAAGVLHQYRQARRQNPDLTLRDYLAQRDREVAERRAAADEGRARPAPVSGDLLAHRGTPQERLDAYRRARAANPDLDLATFLQRSDAIRSGSMANADAARARLRELRREMLAGIPAEQRRSFARVSITEVDDATFVGFTGSQRGRAVTVFINGEPHVVVRRGADASALREEGIHLLQARDPSWRPRVAQLDESRLASWRSLPLDEQLALYRTKGEIEIDGQQRLRAGLEQDLARARAPAERDALARRVAETQTTERALRDRLAEVDGITPERRQAIAAGRERRPQYLEEAPRLFSKAAGPPVDDPAVDLQRRARDEEPGELAVRREVSRAESTFVLENHPDARLYRVGALTDEDGRTYRIVELVDGDVVVDRREEILMPGGRWIESGTSRQQRGDDFEDPARLHNIAQAGVEVRSGDVAAEAARVDVDRARVVPISALSNEDGGSISARHGRAGFDDVYLRFRPDGSAQIVLVEAKNYGRHPDFGVYGAVHANLGQNMARLRAALLDAEFSDPARRAAVRRALDEWDIALEVQHPQRTPIATEGRVLTTIAEAALAWRRLAVLDEAARLTPAAQRAAHSAEVESLRASLKAGLGGAGGAEAAQTFLRAAGADDFSTRIARLAQALEVALPVLPGGADPSAPTWRMPVSDAEVHPRFEELARLHRDERSPEGTRPAAYTLPAAEAAGLTAGQQRLVGDAGEPHATRTSRVVVDAEGNHVVITAPAPATLTPPRTVARALFEQLVYPIRTQTRLIEPRYVVWDAAPIDMVQLGRATRALFPLLSHYPDELQRLRIMIPADRVPSDDLLRALFGFPPGMTIQRAGDQVVVGFQRPPLLLPAPAPAPSPAAPPEGSPPAPRPGPAASSPEAAARPRITGADPSVDPARITAEAEALYARVRALELPPGQPPPEAMTVAANAGLPPEMIALVHQHVFRGTHDLPIGPDQIVRQRFDPDPTIARLWDAAARGPLDDAERAVFARLMAHEFFEARLMQMGLPYRSLHGEAWDDGVYLPTSRRFGADDIAPSTDPARHPFAHWIGLLRIAGDDLGLPSTVAMPELEGTLSRLVERLTGPDGPLQMHELPGGVRVLWPRGDDIPPLRWVEMANGRIHDFHPGELPGPARVGDLVITPEGRGRIVGSGGDRALTDSLDLSYNGDRMRPRGDAASSALYEEIRRQPMGTPEGDWARYQHYLEQGGRSAIGRPLTFEEWSALSRAPQAPSREAGEGVKGADRYQWHLPRSPAYGHSVPTHGAGQYDDVEWARRSSTTGNPQGVWLDNRFIVEAERRAPLTPGEHVINMGEPVGTVYLPDGTRIEGVQIVKVIRTTALTVRVSYPFI
ncbi:hypothetical protein WME94_53965 [Sorangium sp. So ce429]